MGWGLARARTVCIRVSGDSTHSELHLLVISLMSLSPSIDHLDLYVNLTGGKTDAWIQWLKYPLDS